MKKISLIFLFYLIGAAAQCQTTKDSLKRTGFSLEPIVGLGTSEAVQNGSNNLGGRIGLGCVYMFNDHWGISSGLQVQEYSTELASGKDTEFGNEYYVNADYKFTYLELPITARYMSDNKKKIGVFAEAGFTIGYLINSKEDPCTFYDSILSFIGPYSNASQLYIESKGPIISSSNLFNLEGHLAIGIYFLISRRCFLITEVSVNKGFINVGNSSNDYIYTPSGNNFYYYNQNKNYFNSTVSNYGTNSSAMFSVRLNIKLGK